MRRFSSASRAEAAGLSQDDAAALQRAIEQRSRLPVEVLDPFRRLIIDEHRFDMAFLRAHAPEAVVGVGLALRQPGDK